MRGLALAGVLGLALAGSASAELAVPNVQDGMLAVSRERNAVRRVSARKQPRGRGSPAERRLDAAARGTRHARLDPRRLQGRQARPGRARPRPRLSLPGHRPPDESRMAEDSHRTRPERVEAGLAGTRAPARERGRRLHALAARIAQDGAHAHEDRPPRPRSLRADHRERLPEELRRATGRARARRAHGARDRVVRHRRSGRDDRVASAERHLEGPVHRRRVRRLPGRAAPRSGRWQRGVRGVDAGASRRGRAACVARETRAVDRERLRARSRDHDRLRADANRTRRLRRTSGCPRATSGSRETPSSGPVSS